MKRYLIFLNIVFAFFFVAPEITAGIHTIPGKIEVEDYDDGGEGVAYHDTSPGNNGGTCRNDDVDIQLTSDTGGGCNVGWIRDGEWLQYTISDLTDGIYDINIRVASAVEASDRSITVKLDDIELGRVDVLPDTATGGWQIWDDVTIENVFIPGGSNQILRLEMSGGRFNVNWIEFTSAERIHTIPGKIEVEDYDDGGEGVAYHDTSPGNNGGTCRNDDVDIQLTSDTGGGCNVGWIRDGEWLQYTISDLTDGIYDINIRVASAVEASGRSITVKLDDIELGRVDVLPDTATGGWQIWDDVTIENVFIPGGSNQILRLEMSGGRFNVNWIEFLYSGEFLNFGEYQIPPIPFAEEFEVKVIEANGQVLSQPEPIYVYNTCKNDSYCNSGKDDDKGIRATSFWCSGTVKLEIEYNGAVTDWDINPDSKGIEPEDNSNPLQIDVSCPSKLEIQVNDSERLQELLYIFADPPKEQSPNCEDDTVRCCEYGASPGEPLKCCEYNEANPEVPDCVEGPVLTIDDSPGWDKVNTLYIEDGAVLNARVTLKDKKNFRIFGRGFIRDGLRLKKDSDNPDGVYKPLRLENCEDCAVEGIHLYNANWHVLNVINGQNITFKHIKSMHGEINSDGITLLGTVNGFTMEDSFIIGNDNLILFGGETGCFRQEENPDDCPWTVDWPSHSSSFLHDNIIQSTTFVKSGQYGNWAFPQNPGPIGPRNVVRDCDVIRANSNQSESALVRIKYQKDRRELETIKGLMFEDIRVGAFNKAFIHFDAPQNGYERSIVFKNLDLPRALDIENSIETGNWEVVFENVFIRGDSQDEGKFACKDSDIFAEIEDKGEGVNTYYSKGLIIDLDVQDLDNKRDWSIRCDLQRGDYQYGDRVYDFTQVPSIIAGAEWIRSANDSKGYTEGNLIKFKATTNTEVYVAHDDRITDKPPWLSDDWEDTGVDLINNEPVTFSLYKKTFESNSEISLGPNKEGGCTNCNMYTIIAMPVAYKF